MPKLGTHVLRSTVQPKQELRIRIRTGQANITTHRPQQRATRDLHTYRHMKTPDNYDNRSVVYDLLPRIYCHIEQVQRFFSRLQSTESQVVCEKFVQLSSASSQFVMFELVTAS